MKYRLAIFDFDGTLADSLSFFLSVRCLSYVNLPRDETPQSSYVTSA